VEFESPHLHHKDLEPSAGPLVHTWYTWLGAAAREVAQLIKRRLRAARTRAVLAAEDRGARVARVPQLAAARPRALPGA
jgi:hypothetical protein